MWLSFPKLKKKMGLPSNCQVSKRWCHPWRPPPRVDLSIKIAICFQVAVHLWKQKLNPSHIMSHLKPTSPGSRPWIASLKNSSSNYISIFGAWDPWEATCRPLYPWWPSFPPSRADVASIIGSMAWSMSMVDPPERDKALTMKRTCWVWGICSYLRSSSISLSLSLISIWHLPDFRRTSIGHAGKLTTVLLFVVIWSFSHAGPGPRNS